MGLCGKMHDHIGLGHQRRYNGKIDNITPNPPVMGIVFKLLEVFRIPGISLLVQIGYFPWSLFQDIPNKIGAYKSKPSCH